jgi:hypothetical protein
MRKRLQSAIWALYMFSSIVSHSFDLKFRTIHIDILQTSILFNNFVLYNTYCTLSI